MNKQQPLVSICVSYYNDSKFLREHIESILNQTYQNWELILLNHAATDNSREIAHSYNDKRIKHIDYPINIGAMGGLLLKECLKHAKGEYIKFFSADDCLVPSGLEVLINYMEKYPEKDFAFGNVAYVDENTQPLNDTWFENRPNFSLNYTEKEALKCFFDGLSIFPFAGQIIRRSSLSEDYMNNNYIMLFDMNLWSNFLLNGKKVGLIDTVVANYRIHENQMTALSKRDIAAFRCQFELEAYRQKWFSIKDMNLVRYLCSSSQYVGKMDNIKDIPFIIGEYLLKNTHSITGYLVLNNYFEDVSNIKYIYDKFGFSIGDLRSLCAPIKQTKTESWRKVARKYKNTLSLRQLLYLFFYKLRKKYFHHHKHKNDTKKQEYSL